MEYQALYRKYRPTTFSQVIGQDHITTILKNQIITDHVSHAYLFSGTRGTGKTSTAKIFAKAVNCLSPIDGEPCMKCEACTAGIEGNVDIVELDAASNNKVDDVRSLIEKAVFAPLKLKKKVYIIDEAHMLTAQAFNALLKTLEEPPAHVLFILATTEPHKILPTIASRCQRFDFKRLRVSDITKCVSSVVAQAGGHIDDEGLVTIARKANGGMRDALSLADQCLSFCGNNVNGDDVHRILGSMDSDHMFRFVDALITSDAKGALSMFDEICGGRDVSSILQDLVLHMRALLLTLLCDGNCMDILDCTDYDMQRYSEQAKQSSPERLTRAINLLIRIQPEIKYYPQPRIPVEYALVCICRPENETTNEALLDRISLLEKKLENGIQPQQVFVMPTTDTTPTTKQKKVLQSDEEAAAIFKKILDCLHSNTQQALIFASLSLATAVKTDSTGGLIIYFTSEFNIRAAKEHKAEITAAASVVTGCDVDISFKLLDPNEYDIERIKSQLEELFGEIQITE